MIVWSGASGTDTNWSNGNNWVGAVAPGGGDDVKFNDAGAVAALLQPNSLVDVTSAIGTFQFGQTNNNHTVSIASGQTLYVTNGNFIVGTAGDLGVIKSLTNAVSGVGGTLMVSNPAAVISIQAGHGDGRQRLACGNPGFVRAGHVHCERPGHRHRQHGVSEPRQRQIQREGGFIGFGLRTNFITLALTDTLANYQTAGRQDECD